MKRLGFKGGIDLYLKKIEELDKQSKSPKDFRSLLMRSHHDGTGSEIAAFLYIGNGITRHFNFHPLREDFQETHVTPREIGVDERYCVLEATLESLKTLMGAVVVKANPQKLQI